MIKRENRKKEFDSYVISESKKIKVERLLLIGKRIWKPIYILITVLFIVIFSVERYFRYGNVEMINILILFLIPVPALLFNEIHFREKK